MNNNKKARKTYGVYNLVEWIAQLRMGKAFIKVPFTGGSITTQGVTPATYTTENPIIQFAIERSPEFINGKIKVVRQVTLDGVVEIERNSKPSLPSPKSLKADSPSAPAEEKNPNPIAENKEDVTEQCEEAAGCIAEVSEQTTEAPEESAEAGETEEKTESTCVTTQVEFSCNDDAKDFLEKKFGFVRSKLRNREDIVAAGKQKGVEIFFV